MAILSHYTSRAGLEGISSTGILRATSFLDVTGDTSEFFFGWNALMIGAKERFLPLVPKDIRPTSDAFDSMMARVSTELRERMDQSGGAGHLFIASFARGSTDDHERRGILTLWDRYTRHQGYCLQFDEDHVRRLLESEAMWTNYLALGLLPVTYGIRKDGRAYQDCCFQLAQLFLKQASAILRDARLSPESEGVWSPSRLMLELSTFCARHKDPLYEDEREVRLFAYPAEIPEPRPFTGVANVKAVHRLNNGRRYISLTGERCPRFRPNKILVGVRVAQNMDEITSGYVVRREMPPMIERVALPII